MQKFTMASSSFPVLQTQHTSHSFLKGYYFGHRGNYDTLLFTVAKLDILSLGRAKTGPPGQGHSVSKAKM